MAIETTVPQERAVLVGVTLPKTSEAETEASLDELARLAKTLGYKVVARLSQRRGSLAGAAVLGAGKLRELASFTGGSGQLERKSYARKTKAAARWKEEGEEEEPDAELELDEEFEDECGAENESEEPLSDISADVIIFDCELSPSQLSNLEGATGVEVFDRTGVIVEIFSRHARTRAAKLQVEIARLRYLAPRVRVTGSGPGDKKGRAGEKALELDKRKIRDRIAELNHEIAAIEREQSGVRASRSDQCSVALVGYTNAGKSSMMRALTASEVLVEDKLFATLDTTVRTLHPPSIPKILISDTVGFIKKLPTDLVASFRSTLEEALNADHLLYVVDASDPSFRSQLQTTQEVLASIGAHEIPWHLVLNKSDRLEIGQQAELLEEFPDALMTCTKDPLSMASLRDHIISLFEKGMVDEEVFIPYAASRSVGLVRAKVRVLGESHDENGTHFQVRAHPSTLRKLRKDLAEASGDV